MTLNILVSVCISLFIFVDYKYAFWWGFFHYLTNFILKFSKRYNRIRRFCSCCLKWILRGWFGSHIWPRHHGKLFLFWCRTRGKHSCQVPEIKQHNQMCLEMWRWRKWNTGVYFVGRCAWFFTFAFLQEMKIQFSLIEA